MWEHNTELLYPTNFSVSVVMEILWLVMLSFDSSRGLRAMPEESHSALHQGPMGEGKINAPLFSMTQISTHNELTPFMTRHIHKSVYSFWYIWLLANTYHNITQKCSRGEWKNAGNGRIEEMSRPWKAELREQWTPLLQSWLAETLFVWLWSSANPHNTAETPEQSHIKPECVRLSDSQDG